MSAGRTKTDRELQSARLVSNPALEPIKYSL